MGWQEAVERAAAALGDGVEEQLWHVVRGNADRGDVHQLALLQLVPSLRPPLTGARTAHPDCTVRTLTAQCAP